MIAVLRHKLISPSHDFDTEHLLRGFDAGRDCIARGTWLGCGDEVLHFPLFQYLLAAPLKLAGWFEERVLRGLSNASFLSFLGVLSLSGWHLRRTIGTWAGWLSWAILLGSPLLRYSLGTFNEMNAALATLACVVGTSRRWSAPWLAAVFAVATITKETSPLFLSILGLASLGRVRGEIRTLRAMAVGLAVGMVANLAFNGFRFGSPWNLINLELQRSRSTPVASAILGLWFSPNGGLALFWPSFAVLLCGVAVAVGRKPLRESGAFWMVALALGGLTIGFANWWQPFGWHAWGPRLLLPWIPAIVVLLLERYGRVLAQVLVKRWMGASGVCAGSALAVFTLPQIVGGLFTGPHLLWRLFQADSECPYYPDDVVDHVRCLNHLMWGKGSILLETFPSLAEPRIAIHAGLFVLAWAALARLAVRDLRARLANQGGKPILGPGELEAQS